MMIKDLLKDLKHKNIELSVSGADLDVSYQTEELPEDVITLIRRHKAEIISFLNQISGNAAIENTPLLSNYVLSSSQRRLWLLSQFEGGGLAYNVMGAFVFEGELDKPAFAQSFAALIDRHESLRTVFRETEDGEVRQFILNAAAIGFLIDEQDLRSADDQEEVLRGLVGREFRYPFLLSEAPLLRAGLYQVADDQWVFTYVMHHIISDGLSMEILIKELLLFYNSAVKGERLALAPLRIQYKDYAAWQQSQLSGDLLKSHKGYWLDQFSGILPVLDLAGDQPRPLIKTYNGGRTDLLIQEGLGAGIRSLSQTEGGTMFMGLLAALNILLYRYTGQEDIIVGSPIAGREHADLEEQIGIYINTLALRSRFQGTDDYPTVLRQVRQLTLDAYEHQVYPFDELVDALDLKRDMSRNPLFDVGLIFEQSDPGAKPAEQQLAGLRVRSYSGAENVISKFDLCFSFNEVGDALYLGIEYNSDIYHQETVSRMGRHLEGLLSAIVRDPGAAISSLDYLGNTEKEDLLAAAPALALNGNVLELLEAQVLMQPDAVALITEEGNFSYGELNALSNQLSAYLKDVHQVAPGERVGIKLERSTWMVASVIGVFKCGGTYVPIDPEYPQERIAYLLSNSACKVLLDEEELDRFKSVHTAYPTAKAEILLDADALAYVIYTSGSTGNPKGVMVSHGNLTHFLSHVKGAYGNAALTLPFVASSSFDISIFQLFAPLISGGTSVLVKKEVFQDMAKFLSVLQQVNAIDTVPGVYQVLVNHIVDEGLEDHFSHIKQLFIGGDAIPDLLLQKLALIFRSALITVTYGPTEGTIFCTQLSYAPGSTGLKGAVIGSAISRMGLLILDAHGQLCPVGVSGELCITGAGVSQGYLNQPELTSEKFVPHPFHQSAMMYKTGDLGRRLSDGNIVFSGRKDDQVKIRGYRIEPGEIERILAQHELISDAVVLARAGADGERVLVAYLVGESLLNISDIRSYLSARLPSYMVPGHFLQLERLPLTSNGKVDKKAIALINIAGADVEGLHIAPRNEIEEKLVLIWQEVLGREKISVKDHFFELGGHSLKATRLSAKIHKMFDVRVAMKDVFIVPVLEDQAALIEKATNSSFLSIPPVSLASSYALSSSQRRLWVLSQFEDGNVAYNIPGVYVFEGALNIEALERSFLTMIERHEILRTVFKEWEEREEVRQFILPFESVDFKIDYQDFRSVTDRDKVVKELVTQEFGRPFDLSRYPLLRAGLYQLTDHQWVFSYVVQHIISDGWSMGVLIRELLLLYNAYVAGAVMPLAPLRIQYKDYAAWQQSELTGDQFQVHQNYWMNQLSGQLPVLDLPIKSIRPAVKTYNGGLIFKMIDANLAEKLRFLCQEEGGTLFMGLVAAVNVLLYHYTGQEDIIVGSPIAGREHADLEGQIGFYVNTLALRNRFSGKDSYLEVFRSVKGVTLDAYDHQVYPFDKLVEELNLKRDMSRNPLFDVLVDFHSLKTDVAVTPQGLAELKVRNYMAEESLASKFDLTFSFNDSDEGLGLSLEYNSDLFDRPVVEALYIHFENLLTAVLSSAGLPVAELDILTEAEKERQLIDFNIPQGPDLSYRPLLGIFAEQVKKNPEGTALSTSGRSVTYQELDLLSDQLAFYLHQTYDIKANELVGIELERTEWMVIAILGVLKSGAAYVPIDPAYPKSRKGFLSTDTGIRVLITQTDHIFDLDYFSGPVFAIDVQLAGLNAVIPESFKAVGGSSDLAYVIYTSGSTGIPKGCAISHSSLSNYIQWANSHYFDGIPAACFGLYTSLSFDLTVTSIFCALTQGGRLFIYEQYEELSAILRHSFSASSGINSIKLTPSHINVLKYLELSSATVSVAIVGGEALTEAQVGILKKINPSIRIYNEYGPTEATVGCMVSELAEGMPVLIGKPISNTRIYLLNDGLGLCPSGTTGEIYISGWGLAKGYLNDEALSRAKFLPDPYAAAELMYRTGDLGKWLSDGNMVYLGRKDDQVKINGYRIEVGEIVHGLQQHPDVELAVVLLNPDESGAQQLVAYVVGRRDLNGAELRSHLMNSLPVYMVPFQYVQVESIPLTINGKVDQQALLGLKSGYGHQKVVYVAPETEVEIKLVALWEQILHKENIGLKDNFFELGGDSLKATRLVNQLHKVFDVKITLRDVFELATLEEQSFLLGQEEKEFFSTIDPVPAAESYVLSSAQRRLWTLSQSYETSISYNLPDVKILEGALDRNALEGALRSLVLRHEMLRTVFRRDENGEVRQFVLSGPEAGMNLVFRDLRLLGDQQELLDELLEKDAFEIFDLTSGPLLRTHLFQMEDHKWVFAYNMHHIIRDGWSMSIMIKETFLYYNALLKGENLQLSPLRIQYKDYAVWQQAKLKANSFVDHKGYWLEKLSGELPVFRPSDAENRSVVSPYNGQTRNLVIDSPSYHGLKALSQKNGGSLFMGVLTIVNALLSSYTENQDLIVGTLVSGREHIDLENQIGYYVNTLPLRFKFEPEDSYDDLFNRIREITLEGFKHQAYPFDNLVDDLAAVGRKSSDPLFNVMVVLHNMNGIVTEQTNFGKLEITAYPGKMKFKSRFDLTFDFTEMRDKLYVIIRYNSEVYGEDIMDKYVGHLMSLIDLICADSAQRIDCLYDVKDRI